MKQTQGERYQIIARLVVKDLQGTLNRGEKEVLEKWKAESPENKDLYDRFSNKEGYVAELATFHQVIKGVSDAGKKKIEKELNFKIPDVKKGAFLTIPRGYVATAAALLIVIAACIFLQTSHGNAKKGKANVDSTEDIDKYFLRAVKYSNNHFVAVLGMNTDTMFFQSYELNSEPTDLAQYKKAVLDTIARDIVGHVYKNYKPDSSSYTIAADKVFTIEALFTKDVFNQKVAKREFYHTNDFK